MKVVVVVGTKGPFPRLVAAVEGWAAANPGAEVWMQHAEPGKDAERPGWSARASAPHAAVLEAMAAADAVVCHAGSGTLRDALKLGHTPVVVPRLAKFGEHVNDHQLELVEALGSRIVACTDVERPGAMGDAIEAAAARRSGAGEATLPGEALIADLRATLQQVRPARRAPLVWQALEAATRPARRWLRR